MQTIRVATAKFKYNMRPFVEQAKQGKQIIVTNDGEDEFIIQPCAPVAEPPGISQPANPKLYAGLDMNEPAFKSWEDA